MSQDYFAVLVAPCSQAEAEAATDNAKPMTPLRTKQTVDAAVEGTITGQSAKPCVLIGDYTDILFNATSGQGALNVVAIGRGLFGSGTAGTHRITDTVVIGTSACAAFINGNGTVVIGNLAMTSLAVNDSNTAYGDSALRFMTTGQSNTASGYVVGNNIVTGSWNVISGAYAAAYANASSYNVFLGGYAAAGVDDETLHNAGEYNVAIGHSSLRLATGDHNVGIGNESVYNASGDHNLGIGKQAGNAITTGTNNVFLGQAAGSGSSGLQKVDAANTVAIGFNTYTTADNQVVIGNTDVTATVIRGNVSGFGSLNLTQDHIGGTYPTNGAVWKAGGYMYYTGDTTASRFVSADNGTNIMELSNAGVVRIFQGTLQIDNIPTSAPGTAGRIWSDAGVLKITS